MLSGTHLYFSPARKSKRKQTGQPRSVLELTQPAGGAPLVLHLEHNDSAPKETRYPSGGYSRKVKKGYLSPDATVPVYAVKIFKPFASRNQGQKHLNWLMRSAYLSVLLGGSGQVVSCHGQLCLLTDWHAGEPLANLINHGETLLMPLEQRIKIALSMVRQLAILHIHDLVHGDVKPLNYIVSTEINNAFLVDLDGVFSTVDKHDDRRIFTPDYLDEVASIEFESGGFCKVVLDKHTDVYALGLALYMLFTEFCEYADGLQEVYRRAIKKQAGKEAMFASQAGAFKNRLHVGLDRFLQSLVAPNRSDRVPSAVEALAVLEDIAKNDYGVEVKSTGVLRKQGNESIISSFNDIRYQAKNVFWGVVNDRFLELESQINGCAQRRELEAVTAQQDALFSVLSSIEKQIRHPEQTQVLFDIYRFLITVHDERDLLELYYLCFERMLQAEGSPFSTSHLVEFLNGLSSCARRIKFHTADYYVGKTQKKHMMHALFVLACSYNQFEFASYLLDKIASMAVKHPEFLTAAVDMVQPDRCAGLKLDVVSKIIVALARDMKANVDRIKKLITAHAANLSEDKNAINLLLKCVPQDERYELFLFMALLPGFNAVKLFNQIDRLPRDKQEMVIKACLGELRADARAAQADREFEALAALVESVDYQYKIYIINQVAKTQPVSHFAALLCLHLKMPERLLFIKDQLALVKAYYQSLSDDAKEQYILDVFATINSGEYLLKAIRLVFVLDSSRCKRVLECCDAHVTVANLHEMLQQVPNCDRAAFVMRQIMIFDEMSDESRAEIRRILPEEAVHLLKTRDQLLAELDKYLAEKCKLHHERVSHIRDNIRSAQTVNEMMSIIDVNKYIDEPNGEVRAYLYRNRVPTNMFFSYGYKALMNRCERLLEMASEREVLDGWILMPENRHQ